jgi:Icc-related predicted phosphoesterase
MIILFVSDEERFISKKRYDRCDVVVGCGDLSPGFLDYVVSEFRPHFAVSVLGNHDHRYFPDSHEPVKRGFTDIYKGVYLLTKDYVDLRKWVGLNLTIAGFSGAYSHGPFPFHYQEKEARAFCSKMKREKTIGKIKKIDVMISHSPPHIPGYFRNSDYFHRSSVPMGRLLSYLQPPIWAYGHVHPRYGRQELSFETRFLSRRSLVMNAIPYCFLDYDEKKREVNGLVSLHPILVQTVHMIPLKERSR